jgi:hypothetical protein
MIMEIDERILDAVKQTEIIRPPKQTLSTFGTTNLYYYLLTEPAYAEPGKEITETVVREGRVIAEKPRVVTPYYLMHLEGFGADARKYFEMMLNAYGPDSPGIYYTYKNEPANMNILTDNMAAVVDKLNGEIEKRGDALASIIKGKDELWDVSILKFIFEITRNSVQSNVTQFGARGLLTVDKRGVPGEARMRIEQLFKKVNDGDMEPRQLKEELDRWGLFDEYEDRFLALFRKK